MTKKTPEDFTSLAAKWQQRFTTANGNQEKLFKKFADWYDAFNAKINPQTAPWRSKPYMPLIAQQIWSLVSKFSSLRPGFEVKIRGDDLDDEALEEKASKAKKKLEYDYDCPLMDEPMREKLASVLIDACVTGTGIAKVPYKTKLVSRYERVVDDEGIADLTKEKVFEKKIGYNDMEPVNIFNVFVSPATDRLNKGWLIIRDFVAISELKATNDAKGGNFYQNLDQLSGKPSYGEFATYNKSRENFSNNEEPSDATTDIATVYECYEGDMIYFFAEGEDKSGKNPWVLLRKSKNYYWHSKWPIVKFHIKKRPFSFWGQGLAELTYRLQIMYNDVFAHYLDAWNLTNNPSFWIANDNDVDDFVIEPGSLNSYNGQTPPEPINFNKPDPAALQMIVDLLQQSVEGVTASGYATGMTSSASDKTQGTATGILKLQDAAGDIIGYMRENYVTNILQVGKMWHSNNQQFMQTAVSITVSDKGKRETVQVGPADLQGEADVYVDTASMNPKTDEEKLTAAMGLKSNLLEIQQASVLQNQTTGTDPLIINFADLADEVGESLGYQNVSKLLMSEEQVQKMLEEKGAQMGQDAMNESMGLPKNPNEAAAQLTQEGIDSGHINPDELQSIAENPSGDEYRVANR
jgi:hypothetical protein